MAQSKKKEGGGGSAGLIVGVLAALGVGYLIFKPKETAAAAPPGNLVTCKDGSQVPAGAVCMQTCPPNGLRIPETQACPPPAQQPPQQPPPQTKTCPAGSVIPSVPGNAPCVAVIPGGAGDLAPTFQIPGVFFTSLPAYTTTPDDPTLTVAPTDYLVYIQGYTMPGAAPVLPNPSGNLSPAVILTDKGSGGPGGAATAAKSLSTLLAPGGGILDGYYDPQYAKSLEAAGVFVLIWTTDASGTVVSWWVTTWSAS